MYFGANQNHYNDIAPYVKPITMLRSYKGLDSAWPVMPGGLPSLWSSKPNPDDLFAGKLDATYNAALATAPVGSLLSSWWEVDKGDLPASQAREVHTYLHALVTAYNAGSPANGPILYGSVLTCGMHTGNYTVPGLDFYATDAYDIHHDDMPAKMLNAWSDTQPPGRRVIAETGQPVESERPYWFTHAYEWLVVNDGIAFLTFWNPNGKWSGPFEPTDRKTIAALNKIAADAAAR